MLDRLRLDGDGVTTFGTVEVSAPGFATRPYGDRRRERTSHVVRGTDTVGDDLVLTFDVGGVSAVGLGPQVGPDALIVPPRGTPEP